MSTDPDPNRYARWFNGEAILGSGEKVLVLDSTLREGEQSPGISFTMGQRLQIAWMLDYFGVDAIEISPIVSPDYEESCRKIIKAGLNATIVAHVRALPRDIDVALRCEATWIAMYHSVSDIHLKDKLRVTREQAMERAVAAVDYAKGHGLKLRFTMEDASRADPEFLVQISKEVARAGADRISLPDTLGILRPAGMASLVRTVREAVDTPLDIHCHNDLGLALANSLAGVEAGATQIHATVDGLGERVGIPSLAEVCAALTLLYRVENRFRLDMLNELSHLVSSYADYEIPPGKPLVGENAYKHKAGTHLAAVIRNSAAYEILPPKTVGNRRRLVFGELSGKAGAAYLLKMLGLEVDQESAARLAQGLKNLGVGDLFELALSSERESELVEAADRAGGTAPRQGRVN